MTPITSSPGAPVQTQPRAAHRVARVLTEISGPAVCTVAGLLIVAIRAAGSGAGAAWGGLAAIFVAGLPLAFIARGVKAGRWEDHHVAQREKRTVPLLVACASVALGTALLVLVRAPRELIALVVAMLVGLLVVLAVTQWWKISVHVAVAGGFLTSLVVIFGPWALVGLPLLAGVAWSRIVLDAHTWAQTIVGAAAGSAVAAVVFPLLR